MPQRSSLVVSSASTSMMPVREKAEIRPGVTHSALTTDAPSGTGVSAPPTVTMRPSRMITTPSVSVPALVPVHTFLPLMA